MNKSGAWLTQYALEQLVLAILLGYPAWKTPKSMTS